MAGWELPPLTAADGAAALAGLVELNQLIDSDRARTVRPWLFFHIKLVVLPVQLVCAPSSLN